MNTPIILLIILLNLRYFMFWYLDLEEVKLPSHEVQQLNRSSKINEASPEIPNRKYEELCSIELRLKNILQLVNQPNFALPKQDKLIDISSLQTPEKAETLKTSEKEEVCITLCEQMPCSLLETWELIENHILHKI